MNMEYEKELNKVCLHINIPKFYEEDYQMSMLRENEIAGLLAISGCGIEGESRYTYGITGLVSMEALFENKAIGEKDIREFVTCLLNTIRELRKFMLNPGGLLLEPQYIFIRKQEYFFCYLPDNSSELCKSFHQITEYFVKKLDYKDEKGITLAYELHKSTLQDNYDLEMIMEEYQKEKEAEEEELEDTFVFTLNDEESVYTPVKDVTMVKEPGGVWGAWKKAVHRIKREKLPKLVEFILETNRQEE